VVRRAATAPRTASLRTAAPRTASLRTASLRTACLLTAALLTAGLLAGCAASSPATAPAGDRPTPTRSTGSTVDARSPEPARQGTPAASQVDRFVPVTLLLPGKERAEIVPVATVDGELQVPKRVDRLGWWDGSAWLGDPFGATVIAGHVDSATSGIGFFAQLLGIESGQRVTVLGAKGQRQTYEVSSVRVVAQNALADGPALGQTGEHRLVLITCTGAYTPGRGYESNLVVTATQIAPQK
jgi:LPXTG-site transpeptidase (sortase) family protein